MMQLLRPLAIALLTGLVAGCDQSGSSGNFSGADPTAGCDGRCADAIPNPILTTDDVSRILAQGVHEAQARGFNATLAVVDRVGNVLGVYRMGDKRTRFTIVATDFTDADGVIDNTGDQDYAISGGLEGIKLPLMNSSGGGRLSGVNLDHQAAITKAISGAYLSTEGMAFTSRTANQIVQDHFNPGEDFQPGGPLFGVQFSQMACSDFMQAAGPGAAASTPGPHRSPLGLAADPGGLPLYKNGSLVGGIGVMADGIYGIDPFIGDTDFDLDEVIAVAAAFGFSAPGDRRATVTVEGKVFRYTDVDAGSLVSDPTQAPVLGSYAPAVGRLITVRGYSDGQLHDGTPFGAPASGVRGDDGDFDAALDAFVFVDASDTPRFPPRAATDAADTAGSPLTEPEVTAILSNALDVANNARAQIRRPLGTPARVTISVVDTRGEVLGIVRSRDAPVFGADVSLQKARTAAFFSSSDAAAFLLTPGENGLMGEPGLGENVLTPTPDGLFVAQEGFPLVTYIQPNAIPGLVSLQTSEIADYVPALEDFLGFARGTGLDGRFAFTDRAGGNLSRPFYPDGINGNPPGPLSKPPGEWSVFSTGFQLDLSVNAILQHVLFAGSGEEDGTISAEVANAFPPAMTPGCAGKGLNVLGRPPVREVVSSRLANGLQIFPGSVPIYRGSQLVGAIGVSGDGVDQDDLIAFRGVHNASLVAGVGISNAPMAMRADQLQPQGVRLRYVQCPQSPNVDSTVDNVCEGL